MKKHLSYIFLFFICIFYIIIVLKIQKTSPINSEKDDNNVCIDVPEIISRNRLDVLIEKNSINYYVLEGHPYGLQYEMISAFAEYLGVELNITTTNNIENNIHNLQIEKFDVFCDNIIPIKERFNTNIEFSNPFMQSSHVLVSRKQINSVQNPKEKQDTIIIHIPKNSLYKAIINFQQLDFAVKPIIIEVENSGSEQLINAVSKGEIDYTIANYHLARMKSKLLKNIDYSVKISKELPIAWAINSCSQQLRDSINNWLEYYTKTQEYIFLHRRYISEQYVSNKKTNEFFSNNNNKISQYDEVIKTESSKIGWDWRLLSALIYE